MAMGIVKCQRFHEQYHENLQPEERLGVNLWLSSQGVH